ncbi:hypothetical protein [uncultured Ilyobacter sp.]|uniref:hypothetical protein n=1 Tax=uncultured Ilyobacter sp. TaxID=544433 RepID=UPI0029F4B65A|nr:hypothetical protein [uncultured Ilyobacter sp.]
MKFSINQISLTGVLILFASFLLGIKFPDWDLKLKLKHRNILTHSPIVMIFFYKIFKLENSSDFRFFIMGFSVALALHFIFDLFPKGWFGGALLKVPLINKTLSPAGSIASLLTSTIVCIIIAISYTKNFTEFTILFFLGLCSLIFNAKKEKKIIRPFAAFGILYIVMGSVKYEILFRYFTKGVLVLQRVVSEMMTAI